MTSRFPLRLECVTGASRGTTPSPRSRLQNNLGAEVLPCNLGGHEIRAQPKEEESVLFMTTWTFREGEGDSGERIAEGKKLLEAFGRWSVPENETMIAFVLRADGSGGCAISETDDVTALADAAQEFA